MLHKDFSLEVNSGRLVGSRRVSAFGHRHTDNIVFRGGGGGACL